MEEEIVINRVIVDNEYLHNLKIEEIQPLLEKLTERIDKTDEEEAKEIKSCVHLLESILNLNKHLDVWLNIDKNGYIDKDWLENNIKLIKDYYEDNKTSTVIPKEFIQKVEKVIKFLEVLLKNPNGLNRYRIVVSYYRPYGRDLLNETWHVTAHNEKDAQKIILDKYWDCKRKHIDSIQKVTLAEESQFNEEMERRRQQALQAQQAKSQGCFTTLLVMAFVVMCEVMNIFH